MVPCIARAIRPTLERNDMNDALTLAIANWNTHREICTETCGHEGNKGPRYWTCPEGSNLLDDLHLAIHNFQMVTESE